MKRFSLLASACLFGILATACQTRGFNKSSATKSSTSDGKRCGVIKKSSNGDIFFTLHVEGENSRMLEASDGGALSQLSNFVEQGGGCVSMDDWSGTGPILIVGGMLSEWKTRPSTANAEKPKDIKIGDCDFPIAVTLEKKQGSSAKVIDLRSYKDGKLFFSVKALGADIMGDYNANDIEIKNAQFEPTMDLKKELLWKPSKPVKLPGGRTLVSVSANAVPGSGNDYGTVLYGMSMQWEEGQDSTCTTDNNNLQFIFDQFLRS